MTTLASRTLLTVLDLDLDLGSQVLDLDTCVLDSITASDDDDVFTFWQPLYESLGHILRRSLRNFAERLHSLLGLTGLYNVLVRDLVA